MPSPMIVRREGVSQLILCVYYVVAGVAFGHVSPNCRKSPPSMKPVDFHLEHEQARHLLLSNDFSRALPRYEKLTRQYPDVAALWVEYGNAASRLGKFDRADAAWGRALKLAPRNAELIGLIGHQYQGL